LAQNFPASDPRRRLIVALDYPRLSLALEMARRLAGVAGMFKIGSQLFTAAGPAVVEKISRLGAGIFLDLKFHDIPSTVAGSVASAAALPGVELVNVHALGGTKMMRAAGEAARAAGHQAQVVAVTILTSHDAPSLRRVGIAGPPAARVLKLARLARRAGLAGVVCSPREVSAIRRCCGEKFLLVVPGIRPSGAAPNDQARISRPVDAIACGADYLVAGRPITAASNPAAAARAIVEEIAAGLRLRQ